MENPNNELKAAIKLGRAVGNCRAGWFLPTNDLFHIHRRRNTDYRCCKTSYMPGGTSHVLALTSHLRGWTECSEESWAASCLWCCGYKWTLQGTPRASARQRALHANETVNPTKAAESKPDIWIFNNDYGMRLFWLTLHKHWFCHSTQKL